MNSEKINLVVVELLGFGGSFGLDLISRDFDDDCLNPPRTRDNENRRPSPYRPLKMLLRGTNTQGCRYKALSDTTH